MKQDKTGWKKRMREMGALWEEKKWTMMKGDMNDDGEETKMGIYGEEEQSRTGSWEWKKYKG